MPLITDAVHVVERWSRRELPTPSERWRPLFTLYVAGFSIAYALTFLGTLHFIFLGPGLGDEPSLEPLLGMLQASLELSDRTGTLLWFIAFTGLLMLSTAVRARVVFLGYRDYADRSGKPFPLRAILTFTLTNLINALYLPLLLVAGGLVTWALGTGFTTGSGWLAALVHLAGDAVARVPTWVALPRPLAFVVVLLVWTFLHYWLHRLSHTRRALWLLLHRPHHMVDAMSYATTLPVFLSFPFGPLLVVPYLVLFGATGKLFSETPLYAEMILFQLVVYMGEIYGHSPALYDKALRQRWVRWLSLLYCQGLYHVLHHSAAPATCRKTANNTVNLGNGPFGLWDRLFGTFEPLVERCPPIGLHGQPDLVMNPLRLACAGLLQLAWEWSHTSDWPLRWKILTGPADWQPPVSRDFLVHGPQR